MGWWWVGATVVLGVVAASRLRGRRYRYDDDDVRRDVSRWWVPVWAGVGAVLAGPFWAGLPVPLLVTGVLALVWLAVLALIDLEVHRLPDLLTYPAYPVAGVLLVWSSAATDDWTALARAAACSGAAVAITGALAWFTRRSAGFGVGDVKMLGVSSALLGWFAWSGPFWGFTVGIVLGGVAAVVLLISRRGSRRSHMALGPWLVLGTYLVGAVIPVAG